MDAPRKRTRGRPLKPPEPVAEQRYKADRKAGPKSQIEDSALREKILFIIRGGQYPFRAAEACGIPRRTWQDWERWGRQGREPYCTFMHQCFDAEALAESVMVARVSKASEDPKLWTAAAWSLERKYPDRWGMTVKVQQQVQQGLAQMLDVLQEKLPAEEYQHVLEALGITNDEIIGELSDSSQLAPPRGDEPTAHAEVVSEGERDSSGD